MVLHTARADDPVKIKSMTDYLGSQGVARGTTRRAVAAGAYYGSSCGQVVDAYGRVTTRC